MSEPMHKTSLEQMLANIPQQSLSMLDQKVSDIHLAKIARKLIKWKSICTNLGINEAEEEAIEEENPATEVRRYVRLYCKIVLCIGICPDSRIASRRKSLYNPY